MDEKKGRVKKAGWLKRLIKNIKVKKNTKKKIAELKKEIESKDVEIDALKKKLQKRNNEIKEIKRKIEPLMIQYENGSNPVQPVVEKNNDLKFIKTIISIMDELEGLKIFAEKSENEKLLNTINSNLKVINREISRVGLRSESYLGKMFNENYHACNEIVQDLQKENDIIVEEIKLCYFYNDEVVRAAEVIIVDNDDSTDGGDCNG